MLNEPHNLPPMKTIREELKEKVLDEYNKGNIVISTVEGLQSVPLKEFLKQPVNGMLYDLNRNELTVLSFIEDPKWVNDYAVSKVIQELKKLNSDLESKVGEYKNAIHLSVKSCSKLMRVIDNTAGQENIDSANELLKQVNVILNK